MRSKEIDVAAVLEREAGPSDGKHDSRFKALRRAAGLSQDDYAARMGLSISQYSRCEKDPFIMTGHQLVRFAALFGVTVGQVLGTERMGAPATASSALASFAASVQVYRLQDVAGPLAGIGAAPVGMVHPQERGSHAVLDGPDTYVIDAKRAAAAGDVVLALAPVTGEAVVREWRPFHPTDPRAPGGELVAISGQAPTIFATREHPAAILGVVVERHSGFG